MSGVVTLRELVETIVEGFEESRSEDTHEWADLACSGCGRSVPVTEDLDSMVEFVEHTLFDHVVRADIHIQRSITLLSANETAQALGLAPRTEAEAKWRKEHAI